MIEQGIYFALGCIITALLALLFAPVFWRRALRLTRQRLALQVPLSMQEILAQRDQIRAEHAVDRLRTEQAMEAVAATKAADMAEIGRRSAEAFALKSEVDRLRQTEQEQQSELARRRREAAEASAEIGALHLALHHGEDRDDVWRDRATAALRESGRLQADVDSLQATVASLKANGVGLEMRLAERRDDETFKRTEAALRARLEAAVAQATRHEAANLSVRRELDEAKALIRRLEADLEAANVRADGRGAATVEQDAGFRETIHALGIAVADLRRQAHESPDPSRRAVGEVVERPLGVA